MKFSFKNDYSEGCHPKILAALADTNFSQQNGYGSDDYCKEAERLIQDKIKNYSSKVYFVSGGTQANLISISAFLRPHESVIAAETGHIVTNETGAIEATGHKIHTVSSSNGKLQPADISEILERHQNIPHQVKPRLVYISNSTELGTIYSKTELQQLSECCKDKNLLLFLDGARLSHALAAETNDLSVEEIAQSTDAFYWGGTKNGALIGEAIVLTNENLRQDFAFHLKQKGALLAKGRLIGLQFQELLKGDLYLKLARHANQQTMKIKSAFAEKNITFLTESFTNQIFPILNRAQIEQLSKNFDFYLWKKIDPEHTAIRIISSWASTDDAVGSFVNEIDKLLS